MLLLLHVPPDALWTKETVAPGQTLDGPLMLPAYGDPFTDIGHDATAVPHPLVTEYLIVSRPVITPVTAPPIPTVALVFELLHVPPVVASVRVMVDPAHTPAGPLMLPALGALLTATLHVADAVPQLPLTVYDMVDVPADTPVTTPPDTVASALLLLHVPPGAASVRVIVDPIHTPAGPLIVPVTRAAPTVTGADAIAVPQALVTV